MLHAELQLLPRQDTKDPRHADRSTAWHTPLQTGECTTAIRSWLDAANLQFHALPCAVLHVRLGTRGLCSHPCRYNRSRHDNTNPNVQPATKVGRGVGWLFVYRSSHKDLYYPSPIFLEVMSTYLTTIHESSDHSDLASGTFLTP